MSLCVTALPVLLKGNPPEGEVILDTGVCPCNVQDHLPCRENYKLTLVKQSR